MIPDRLRAVWYRLMLCRSPGPSDSGAHGHWYCQHRRGHVIKRYRFGRRKHTVPIPGPTHRYRNYVWLEGTQAVTYSPLPLDLPVLVPWDGELAIRPRSPRKGHRQR